MRESAVPVQKAVLPIDRSPRSDFTHDTRQAAGQEKKTFSKIAMLHPKKLAQRDEGGRVFVLKGGRVKRRLHPNYLKQAD